MDVILFGKKVFADVIKDLKMRSSWISGWVLNSVTNVLIRNTQRRERWRSPSEDPGRDGN